LYAFVHHFLLGERAADANPTNSNANSTNPNANSTNPNAKSTGPDQRPWNARADHL
jgi:hypothetical protein